MLSESILFYAGLPVVALVIYVGYEVYFQVVRGRFGRKV
jgi:hypothetical protein